MVRDGRLPDDEDVAGESGLLTMRTVSRFNPKMFF